MKKKGEGKEGDGKEKKRKKRKGGEERKEGKQPSPSHILGYFTDNWFYIWPSI